LIQITPENISRHEFIGLDAKVVEAPNTSLINISGKIVNETMKTFHIGNKTNQTKIIPKSGTKLEVKLPNNDYVVVEGNYLISRPERRTQKTGGSIWH
jgi:ribonuclease P protein subunit POP4|tara:strand:- start:477 stop:770 length:294 start_codon:yes stop_codon:yes gene_type:complete